MTKINWDAVDRNIFAEFRLASTEELAQAFLNEAFEDAPNDNRLNTLYEMGQGRFSESLNNRSQREALFNLFVNRLNTKAGA